MAFLSLVAAALPLWFCADFDAPAELNGESIETVSVAGVRAQGRFGEGFAFVSDKRRCENEFIRLKDSELLKAFPSTNGTFVCWFRSVDEKSPMGAAFALGKDWNFRWGWDGGCFRFSADRRQGVISFGNVLRPTANWRHFAATWNPDEIVVYLNGVVVGRKEKPDLDMARVSPGDALWFGSGPGRRDNPACGFVMDDLAIISRALTASEVAELVSSDSPIRMAPRGPLPEHDYFQDMPVPCASARPIVLSWGGNGGGSLQFLRELGVNTVNVDARNTERAREVARAGFCVNVRLENSGDWRRIWSGTNDVLTRARAVLRPYRTLGAWRSTLVNSEVYQFTRVLAASSNEQWRSWAAKDMGRTPDLRVQMRPVRVDYEALGIAPCEGVLPDDFPAEATISWAVERGHPVSQVNRINRVAVKELSPDNVVWSEPSPSARGLDMLADWMYAYDTTDCLHDFVSAHARARSRGVSYMPTLSGSYHGIWHIPVGRHPTALGKDGKPLPVGLAQSCDEVKIKCWMALGAAPLSCLSLFNAAAWEKGAANAAKFASDPQSPITLVAETDFASRFGVFMRESFLPQWERLKGVGNASAPIALLQPDELQYAGKDRWTYGKYSSLIGQTLARGPVAFDVLCNDEICAERLARYRYVILPMGNVLKRSRYDALCAVAGKTRVVTDATCRLKLPYAEQIPMRFDDNKNHPDRMRVTTEPLESWLAAHRDELRRASFAWSEQDGRSAFTFVKQRANGRKTVIVVNDAREERSLWPEFCTDARYRPMGAPNRISVHFNLPDGERVEALDFAPAEAKVFDF